MENAYIDIWDRKRLIKYSLNIHFYHIMYKSRNENPAYKEAFNSLIYDLKKKNPKWSRTSVDDDDLISRAVFMEENTDEEVWFLQQTIV